MSILNNTTSLQEILNTVNNLPNAGNGVQLPSLSNEGSASDLLSGKQLIDGDGNVVTGTIPTKTSSNLFTSGATVFVPSGYYADIVDKTIASVTQATPSITINASGLITATATQSAGYVPYGIKSATKQLAFQAAKTITPTTTSQTAVSSGYYTGGSVIVKGDNNLVAGNIKSGVSIFGVTGNYVGSGGSGGGNTDVEDGLITRQISVYENDRVTSIGSYAFYGYLNLTSVSFLVCTSIGSYVFRDCRSLTSVSFPVCTSIGSYAFNFCSSLTSVSFPACTSIGDHAFYGCSSLTSISFPVCTSIGSYAFGDCSSLTSVSFPVCPSIGSYAFRDCRSLTSVSFPVCTSIGNYAFGGCSSLTSVSFPICTSISSYAFYGCRSLTVITLGVSSVCNLLNSNAFTNTKITSTTGSILVNPEYVSSYKTATNWTYFSNRIFAIGT